MSQKRVLGEYYFSKMEMASGFNFAADGKFEFFFSYGAVDRSATGTFSVEGNVLKLTSNKEPGKDFAVTSQSKQPKGYTLTFNNANKFLVKNILCVFLTDGQRQEAYTDDNGEAFVDLEHCDTIYVQHTLFPDIFTLVKDKANDNNQFELLLNPSLAQVSFKGIDFKIENDTTLSCIPNYFLDLPDITFIKK
ncbi:MAG: hypothetical protein ABI472_07855 [Ginsengibacter sp.]